MAPVVSRFVNLRPSFGLAAGLSVILSNVFLRTIPYYMIRKFVINELNSLGSCKIDHCRSKQVLPSSFDPRSTWLDVVHPT